MSIPRVATAVLLLAGSAWLGARSDATRATPRPPPGPASLLGGFSAIAVQVLQMRADSALREHRTADVLLYFQLITELEPHLVDAAASIAHELGFNLSKEQTDPEASWDMAHEGLRVLDRCVEVNPGIPAALLARGTYKVFPIARNPEMAARFERDRGKPPVEAAVDDFRAIVELEPEHEAALHLLAQFSLVLALEDYPQVDAEAVERAREAVAGYDQLEQRLGSRGELDDWQGREMPGVARALLEVLEAPAETRSEADRAFRQRFPDFPLTPHEEPR